MASRSDVITHFKHKFYKRYIDPDIVVEPMSSFSTSSSQQHRSSATTTSSTSSARRRIIIIQYHRGSGNRSFGTYPTQGPNPTRFRWDRQTIQFAVNAWVPLFCPASSCCCLSPES